MAILHGNWLSATQGEVLFIWGEIWRGSSFEQHQVQKHGVPCHPFAMAPTELADFMSLLQQTASLSLPEAVRTVLANQQQASKQKRKPPQALTTSSQQEQSLQPQVVNGTLPFEQPVQWGEWTLALPSKQEGTLVVPYHSATPALKTEDAVLQPWWIPGLYLDPNIAIAFLTALPLKADRAAEASLGDDLRFWSHIARWSLDLLARSKFLPGVELESGQGRAYWQPLLDSATDRLRLKNFSQRMPSVCRCQQSVAVPASVAVEIPPEPVDILAGFLRHTIDAQVRAALEPQWMLAAQQGQEPIQDWLQALGPGTGMLSAQPGDIEHLQAALDTWTTPIHSTLQQQRSFRTCFYLHPPEPERLDWCLEYFLQAVDDPEILIGAETIWSTATEHLSYRGRTIERPQETLLLGLGLASRIYPPIESSLQNARPQQQLLTPPQAYEFLKTVAWRLEDSGFGIVLPPSLENREGWANRLGLKVRAEAPALSKSVDRLGLQSLLNFQWELSIGGQTLSKAQFDRLVKLNTPLVEINGEWVELRPQDVKAAQAFFAARQDQTSLSLEDALRLSTGDTLTLEKLPVVSFEAAGSLQQLMTTLTGNQTLAPIATPKDFQGKLRPYQAKGAGWLAFLERWGLGACLADDMGLGKTIELIAFLLHQKEQKALTGPTLLVCPTSVLGNWEREVKRFAPTLQVAIHHGDKRASGKAFTKAVKGKDLVITSYPLVYRDERTLGSVTWQGIVLDEAQNIKNPDAKQSRTVRQLAAQFRIALTGTPLENRLTELWSILDFLNPGYLGARNFFQRRFAIPIERYGDTDSLQTLRSLVQPFILRRLKTDREIIQDLPEKQEMSVFCGLTPEQATLYEQVVQESLAQVEAAAGIQRRGIILATLVKLKQVCNHPAQFLQEKRLHGHHRSGKLKRLSEMLEEALSEGDRALVFTQFAQWGKLLKHYLEEHLGQETLFLYGGSSRKDREAMVDRFQHDPYGPRIFILSLKAGGVGLNLTRANHVFHFDRWWNPAVENQATDRVFRIGQTRNVQVHKFVCTGTLEEKIHEQIESKKALAEQVVGAGENWLADLDTEQLRNLLLLERSAVIEEETL